MSRNLLDHVSLSPLTVRAQARMSQRLLPKRSRNPSTISRKTGDVSVSALECRAPRGKVRYMPSMLEPVIELVLRLVDQLRTEGARAIELRTLRRRFARSLEGVECDDELRRRAVSLRAVRQRLSQALGPVESCRSCVRPRCDPWPGGHCCSGSTQAIFTGEELAALRLGGTTAFHFVAPREPLRGCVFRGRAGCTIPVEHRPNLCVRYTCRELEFELEQRGDRCAIAELQRRLRIDFERFSQALRARLSEYSDSGELELLSALRARNGGAKSR